MNFPIGIVDDIAGLRTILCAARSIAVVGLSANWHRPSFFAAKYMQDHDYRIHPVNPRYSEVLGRKCFPSLIAIDEPVDIVDCFRKSAEIEPLAHQAVAIGARVLWMQLGVVNDRAAQIATDAGLAVVMNRCVKIEHARVMGGLNWAGVNTGVISSKRGLPA
jgi:predicted CoA-binding protein